MPIIYTKESLVQTLLEISQRGPISNLRHGNVGGIGNTLEDLLGIEENNLPIPNAGEWELKTQRLESNALTTLFHMEPSPRAIGFVPKILLPKYGWTHQDAGGRHPASEMSFRQTLHGKTRSDRGFKIQIDRDARKVLVSFASDAVAGRHAAWLNGVRNAIGLGELDPQPYWGFDDLAAKARTKLLNAFYVQAKVTKRSGAEFYEYKKVMMLRSFSFDKFLTALDEGNVLVDFDARSGHNHGTKFRLRQKCLPDLYSEAPTIIA